MAEQGVKGTAQTAAGGTQDNRELFFMLGQLAGALSTENPAQAGSRHQQHHDLQQRQAAAVAAANNQQQVHALMQHQMNLLQMQQQAAPDMPVSNRRASQQQQQQQQTSTQQQATAGAAYQFNSMPGAAMQPDQLEQQQQEEEQPDQPQKRRRGRPASSSTRVHPNLVYVRRFRERQKQMEVDLEAAVEARKQQVQQLQEEQQQLCVKWEALEQVLQVQNNVLCLMQQLQLADPAAAIAGAEAAEALLAGTTQQDGNTHMHDEDGAKQRSQQQQQNGDTHLPDQEQTDAQGKRPCSPAHNKAASQRRCPPDTAAAAAAAASKAGAKDSKLASSPAPDEHTVEAAVAEAAALLREAAPPPDPSQDQALLLQQARQWLEPVKLYTLRAALMLEQLGMLPANPAAQAALAAAQACPAAVAPGPPLTPVATATVVSAAISAAAAEAQPAAIAKAAAAVAVAVRSAWDGSADGVKGQHEAAIDGVPLVQYPYSIGMYVITPDAVKNLCWPLNMATGQVDDGNNQAHAERAGRAMWAVLSSERWRLLRATWLTMSNQLQQVQQDFMRLHHLLQTIGARSQPSLDASSASSAQSSPAEGSWPKQQRQQRRKAEGSSSEAGSSLAAAAAAVVQAMQQQASHGLSIDGFASVEDSTAFEYAAAAVQVESVLLREDAISFQLCGAFLELMDPLEIAVGYVSSWPYHPQVFTIFDIIFKLGEPPEEIPGILPLGA